MSDDDGPYGKRTRKKKPHRVAKFATADPPLYWGNHVQMQPIQQVPVVAYAPPPVVLNNVYHPPVNDVTPNITPPAPATQDKDETQDKVNSSWKKTKQELFVSVFPKDFDICRRGSLPGIKYRDGIVEFIHKPKK